MQLSELAMLSSYAGPPVIGAFIGYVTNRIAIKMLFRPLNPWRIAGVRIPMTPGVIPSKRHDLADNIGEMVGEHLLTSKEVGEALSREPFQEHLNQLVEKQLIAIVEKEYDAVCKMIPEGYAASLDGVLEACSLRLGERAHTYFHSEAGERQVLSYVGRIVKTLGEQQINTIISSDSRKALYQSLGKGIGAMLSSSTTREHLAAFVNTRLIAAADQGNTVGDLVPDSVTDALQALVKEQTPMLMRELGLRMGDPVIRKRIINGVIAGVDRFIDSMGPVGAMARGFIDMNSLETVIDTYLTEKEDDIISWLQEPEVTGPVEEVLIGRIDDLFGTSLAEIMEKAGPEQVEEFCLGCVDRFAAMMVEGRGGGIEDILEKCLEATLDDGESVFSSLFPEGVNDQNALPEKISDELLRFLQSDTGRTGIDAVIREVGRMVVTKPIGSVSGIFSADILNGMKESIVRRVNRVLLAEVPGLVRSLEINRLITEKVNSLDLLKLEGLLLSIMEEQFKYINLFGALLGFIIGCVNLLLLRLV